MSRRLLAPLFLFALIAAAIPPPVFALEEGHHAHLGITNLPIDTVAIPRSNRVFHLILQAHAQTGLGRARVRVSDYSTVKPSIVNGVRASTHNVSTSALQAGPVALDMTVPFAEWSCGRHELRFTIDFDPNFEGNRQFTTSRSYLLLTGCTTDRTGRSTSWHGGGGGWYVGQEYAIGIQQSTFPSIRAGASTSWRVQSNANRGCLFVNPSAHAGTMGRQVGSCWTGTGTVARTLPSDLVPGDKVMLYAEDTSPSKQHAGTYVVTVPAAGATSVAVDYQDWWNDGGLIVP